MNNLLGVFIQAGCQSRSSRRDIEEEIAAVPTKGDKGWIAVLTLQKLYELLALNRTEKLQSAFKMLTKDGQFMRQMPREGRAAGSRLTPPSSSDSRSTELLTAMLTLPIPFNRRLDGICYRRPSVSSSLPKRQKKRREGAHVTLEIIASIYKLPRQLFRQARRPASTKQAPC